MSKQRTNLSLHKAIHHKAYLLEDTDNLSFCETLLENDKYLYHVKNKDELFLFDMNTKEIIEKFDNAEKVNIEKYSAEELIISGVYPSPNTIIKLPVTLKTLVLEGAGYMAELMSKNEKSSRLWNEILYELQLSNFNTTVDERIERDEICRILYNTELQDLKLDSPIFSVLSQITELDLNWLLLDRIYLTERELKLLSGLKGLERLTLSYIYNDSVLKRKLPPNLNYLRIYGNTIENLSDINLKGLPLETLELDGNTIKNLYGISKLKNLLHLNLDNNLIRYFDLNDLPKNVETLSFDVNMIGNDFFEGTNNGVINNKITHLILSNNNLKINPWLIYRITKTFPKLENIDLSGNETEGIPYDLLINSEEESSMAKIARWLDLQDSKYTESYSDLKFLFNYYNKTNTIIIKWKHDSLPTKNILADIQYHFNRYFESMPEFKRYKDGIYCDIVHDEISLIIREDANSIYLEFYTSNHRILNDYFYKYFQEINNFIKLSTHHSILPVAIFSENCGIYEKFFKFVFHIDKKILDNFILVPNAGELMALIKTQRKGFLEENNNKTGHHYKKIKNIAFIILKGKEAFPYIIDENNVISNIEKENAEQKSKKAFELSLREGNDKKNYVESLTNPYLGSDCMEEAVLFVKGNVKEKVKYPMDIIFNSRYFSVVNDKLCRKTSAITMSKEYVMEPKTGMKITGKEGQQLECGKKITITFDENDKMLLDNIVFSEKHKKKEDKDEVK
jgi:hypothetical protein